MFASTRPATTASFPKLQPRGCRWTPTPAKMQTALLPTLAFQPTQSCERLPAHPLSRDAASQAWIPRSSDGLRAWGGSSRTSGVRPISLHPKRPVPPAKRAVGASARIAPTWPQLAATEASNVGGAGVRPAIALRSRLRHSAPTRTWNGILCNLGEFALTACRSRGQ
jgi:hypothetical protein